MAAVAGSRRFWICVQARNIRALDARSQYATIRRPTACVVLSTNRLIDALYKLSWSCKIKASFAIAE